MSQYYVFFVRDILPQAEAHLVQMAHLANAAANLGYPTVLLSLDKGSHFFNPLTHLTLFQPQPTRQPMRQFYNLQDQLQTATLPVPKTSTAKWTNPSTLVCKYYLPFHLRSQVQLVHSRDWNFVKAAVQNGIPAIYERDHYEKKKYDPEIVKNPLFKVAVTVADNLRNHLIENGIPPEKVIKLHNGFNQLFYERHPEAAKQWRTELLKDNDQHLVVYAGELLQFKGIDLLIEIAQQMPTVQFALAGGKESQIQHYQQILQNQAIHNVTLVGYLPHHRLASFLQAADLLVYPHLSGEAASFTSPMKLFDYLAAGRPIVATQITPLQEFQTSDLVATWCSPDCSEALRQGIQKTLQQYPQWSIESIHSWDTVKKYSWEHRIEQTLEYVELDQRPPQN
ncbi:glycosyltransferase family 4 protein [Spirulina sp. CS-785/01]|uniref:glycosyltransferase family 4 protein n=1 Tax=Spirulina sp. CS-785/01 TaxID=3021716 RepID=UPI00232DAAA3|nr:glycosyltransferase family 4 protein [Spirulina sp. CS-785/01]MDB9312346.1 glycosyltransferase family 4 protein [Spirulina sp. CS-785/01]